MKEEKNNCPKLSDNLEEAAKEFFPDFSDSITYKAAVEFMRDAFIAGAEWQKEQDQETIELAEEHAMLAGRMQMKEEMMKDAVEGTVHNFSSNKPHPTVLVDAKGFNQGDKVRIIIVKEEG